MLVSITFLNNLGVSDGSIVVNVQAETNGGSPGTTNNLQVGIIGPGGIVVQQYNEADALTTFADLGSGIWSTQIPLDANGKYIAGEYAFTVSLRKTGSTSRYTLAQETFTYNPVVLSPGAPANNGLTYAVDCQNAEITFNDTTDVAGYINVSRAWLLQHPLPTTGSRPADLTSTSQNGSFTFSLTGGEYTLRLILNRQLQVEEGAIFFNQTESLSKTVTFLVNCGANLCSVYSCFKNGYDDQLASVNWNNASLVDIGKAIKLLLSATGAILAKDCDADAFAAFAESTDICGCGCASPANQVVPYP